MCCFSVFTPPTICMPRPFFGCGPMPLPFMGCAPLFPFGRGYYNPGNALMVGLGAGLGYAAGNIIGGLINRLC